MKILDFGLAKLMPSLVDSEMKTLDRVKTKDGVILGTVHYMSPEQASGRPVDFRSDQFSLGSILYEMATRKRPFRRETVAETLTAIIREDPDPITGSSLSPAMDRVIQRCLSKDPMGRYDSTTDIAKDLRWGEHASPAPRSTRHLLTAVGLVVPVVLLLFTYGLFVSAVRERAAEEAPIPKFEPLPLARTPVRVETLHRNSFGPQIITPAGTIFYMSVVNKAEHVALRLQRCNEPCDTAVAVRIWQPHAYALGDVLIQRVDQQGRYYLWAQDIENDLIDASVSDTLRGDQLRIRFNSGTIIDAWYVAPQKSASLEIDGDYGTLAFRGTVERIDMGDEYEFRPHIEITFKRVDDVNPTTFADLRLCALVATIPNDSDPSQPAKVLYRQSKEIAVMLSEEGDTKRLPDLSFRMSKSVLAEATHVGLYVSDGRVMWPIPGELANVDSRRTPQTER